MMISSDLPLGRRLRVLRVVRGIRQRELAILADLPQATLSAIENSYRPPHPPELVAILGALGASRTEIDLPPEAA